MSRLCFFAFASLLASFVHTGCASDDDGGSCSGSVTSCRWADLDADQEAEACDVILASISDPPGTVYTCNDGGDQDGLNLTVDDAATCKSHTYPDSCEATVKQAIDCYKAAATDACAAFADTGACGKLINASGCQ